MRTMYRTALVTGATSGIGEAFARLLPSDCSLVITGRNGDQLAALAEELGRDGRDVHAVTADLATAEGRRRVIGAATDRSIDLLVCNAGSGVAGRFGTTPIGAERESLAVNVAATL